MDIEVLDVCDCKVSKALSDIIKSCLEYPAVFYQQGPYRKIRKEYMKSVITKGEKYNYFPTGLLPRVIDYCKGRNIDVNVIGKIEKLGATKKPTVNGLELREEQLHSVNKAIKIQRGVLVAPTGTGKTAMGMAVISAFPKASVLWLCHTKDLMYQAADEAKKLLLLDSKDIGFIGDGKNNPCKFTFATRQSFVKVVDKLGCDYDIVIIDETHHISEQNGQYGTLMRHVLAPVRIGLTATMPTDKKAILAIEGSLGPIIDEITIEEGQERGIMAKIRIKFLRVPIDHKLRDLRKYSDVYDAGVVNNQAQHRIIVETTQAHVEKGDAVLILVTRIQHGENLLAAFERAGVQAYFAQGITESALRKDIKDALNLKHIHVVIATTIFQEGINIPELNVLINAAGGKSEIRTIQAIGRGLRLTETKKLLILYDVLNLSHNYLIAHVGERLMIYSEMNWI